MKRRTFIRATAGLGMAGLLAGCSSDGNDGPPPRESEVVSQVALSETSLTVQFEDTAKVQSRAELDSPETEHLAAHNPLTAITTALSGTADTAGDVAGALSPVGVAAAKGRGTGKGGIGSAAGTATGRNGRAKWAGAAGYGVWWSNHEDDVDEYAAEIPEAGIAHLAPLSAGEGDLPGPGPVPWDKTWEPDTNDLSSETLKYDFSRTGWYRVGAHLVAVEGDHDFGWEAIDFRVVEADDGSYEIDSQWKVSPRL